MTRNHLAFRETSRMLPAFPQMALSTQLHAFDVFQKVVLKLLDVFTKEVNLQTSVMI